MDLWATHAKRKRVCINCTQVIMPGDRVMIGQWKRSGTYQGKWATRTTQVMSHFACWVSRAEVYLDDNPYVPPNNPGPGRPTKYTEDQLRLRRNTQMQIKRLTGKQQYYNGQGLWAVAGGLGDRVRVLRESLVCM